MNGTPQCSSECIISDSKSDEKLGRGGKLSIDSAAYLARIYKVLCDLCDKFICQVHVCICNKFYMTSFHMTSFIYWCGTCQQVYFDNLLVTSNVIVQRTTRALANHNKCSDYFDKFLC